ncbi:MAG: efflux RND transporter permease subunit [Alphaproteobacteria bacterium]
MKFLDFIFSRAKMVLTLVVILFIMGVINYSSIPKEDNPDIQVPMFYVSLGLEGITPEDSEKMLIQPMETRLKSLSGVKKITSTGYKGGGNVILEFYAGTDLTKAYDDIKKAVEEKENSLPKGHDKTKIHEINVSDHPIIDVNIWGDADFKTLLSQAKQLKDKFKAIPTVLDVSINGERDEVVNIMLKPEVMEFYELTPSQISNALKSANTILPTGAQQEKESGFFNIKIPNSLDTIEQVLNTPILSKGDNQILLKDIATYNRSFTTNTVNSRVNGRSSINISITKKSGSNLLNTVQKVINIVDMENKNSKNKNIHISISNDASKEVNNILRDLQNNIITAILLIMVVVVSALGLKNGLLVGVSIPLSFLSGIIVLNSIGFSLNIVVLFGLILSIGMLVDGAIVVSEFAQRKIDEGFSSIDAFKMSISKMARPVIASMATTLVAFLPLTIWPGMVGEFMKYIPITLIIVLSSSLIVALIIMPVIGVNINSFAKICLQGITFVTIIIVGSYILTPITGGMASIISIIIAIVMAFVIYKKVSLKLDTPSTKNNLSIEDSKVDELVANGSIYLKKYKSLLDKVIAQPVRVIALTFVMLIVSWGAFIKFGAGTTFFPNSDASTIRMNIHSPGNLSLHEKEKLVSKVEQKVFEYNEKNNYIVFISTKAGTKSSSRVIRKDKIGGITLELQHWELRPRAKQIEAELQKALASIKGVEVRISRQSNGPRSGADIQMNIIGSDRNKIAKSTTNITEYMKSKNVFSSVDSTIDTSGIEFLFIPNKEAINKAGINISTISNSISMLTKGMKISTFRPNYTEDEVKILLKYPSKYQTITGIEELRIQTPKGPVPIIDLVDKKYAKPVNNLLREGGKKIEKINANVKTGYIINNEIKALEKEIRQNNLLEKDTDIEFKGNKQSENESKNFLVQAFFVVIFLMAMILLLEFNSFYLVGVILFSVILSTVGVVLGLVITGKPFSIVMSGLAIISLAGIVVNNNIVLIDTFKVLKRTEKDTTVAIIKTAIMRLRPILLTSTTTALGLLPTALGIDINFVDRLVHFNSPSSQMWTLLSQNILTGLMFSTILTLFVTPAILSVFYNRKKS